MLKADLIPLANTLTHGFVQYHLDKAPEFQLPLWLVHCLTLRKYPCYNVEVRKCKPTNARTLKYANCLHLLVEQLFGAC